MHRQPLNTATSFRGQFLPEPTHVNENSIASGGLSENLVASSGQEVPLPSNNMVSDLPGVHQADPFYEGAILAESYFAQGDDFIGNMDDWWLQSRSI